MYGGVATLPVPGRTWRYPLITQKLNYAKLVAGQFHEWPSLPGFLTFFNSDTTGVKSPILDPSIQLEVIERVTIECTPKSVINLRTGDIVSYSIN